MTAITGILKRVRLYGRQMVLIYGRLFSVAEIGEYPVLQWLYGAILFGFYLTFSAWSRVPDLSRSAADAGQEYCWSYFENCGDYFFLQAPPEGYTQLLFYACLFFIMLVGTWALFRRRLVLAHFSLLILFVWKVLVMYLLTRTLISNADIYHIIITATFLFLPYKAFFTAFVLVFLYFISVPLKLSEGWILGTIFTATKEGLPLISNSLVPFATNALIFIQTVEVWFLFSRTRIVRIIALTLLFGFHLYSVLIVGYTFPAISLLPLLALFFLFPPPSAPLRGNRVIVGWVFMALLLILQLATILPQRDFLHAREGNVFLLRLFNAHHQCVSELSEIVADGYLVIDRREQHSTWMQCDPARDLSRFKQRCEGEFYGKKLLWTFDHSVNGGPFYRIVEVADPCALSYSGWGSNRWIKTPQEGAPVVGYPVVGSYYGSPYHPSQ